MSHQEQISSLADHQGFLQLPQPGLAFTQYFFYPLKSSPRPVCTLRILHPHPQATLQHQTGRSCTLSSNPRVHFCCSFPFLSLDTRNQVTCKGPFPSRCCGTGDTPLQSAYEGEGNLPASEGNQELPEQSLDSQKAARR